MVVCLQILFLHPLISLASWKLLVNAVAFLLADLSLRLDGTFNSLQAFPFAVIAILRCFEAYVLLEGMDPCS